MKLSKFEVGPFAENTYLLEDSGKAILIDPGFSSPAEFNRFKGILESELIAVILTHAHVDHVMGLNKVLKEYDVPVYLSDENRFLWENYPSQAQMFGIHDAGFDVQPQPLPSGKLFEVGPFEFRCLYTPGHAPDHVSLYFEDEQILIAGDLLFRESIGRTDLYEGSFEVLEKSIREQIYPLPDEVTVYPGHGPSTTIGHEKKNNPFVSV